LATTTADGRYYTFTIPAVRRSIDRLAKSRSHEQFPGYLALLHYEVSRDEVERDAADIANFYRKYLEVPGAPENRPFLQPFRSRGSGIRLSNSNTSGSYSEASIRPGRPLSHVLDIVPAAHEAKRVYRLKKGHAEAVLSEMLFGQPVPAVALAAFLFRDRAFSLPSPAPAHVVEVLRAWLHLDPGSPEAGIFDTLFADDSAGYDPSDLEPFAGLAAGDVTDPVRSLSLADLALEGLTEGGSAILPPPTPEQDVEASARVDPDSGQPAPHDEPREPIEGLDFTAERDRFYPLEDIMVRSETRTVGEVVRRIETGRYVMDPDFQRDFVWTPEKQSKLIESCVMRIPLPVLYVAEGEDGRITVVDGLQRLSTFAAFRSGALKLTGFAKRHPLDGKRFADLSVQIQERIEDTQLVLYILDKDAPDAVRLDIFDRVNSGVALSRQQMRNALYNGPATRWLATMARTPEFLSVTDGKLSTKIMRDREAINRFAAFHVMGWQKYNGDMEAFLADALKMINRWSEAQLAAMKEDFLKSMRLNQKLFHRHAFRKSLMELDDAAYRSVINISMFDTFSVYFATIDENRAVEAAGELRRRLADLVRDESFNSAITFSTNSTVQVRTRFRLLENVLSEWL
jgi:hypothetical protein